MKNQKIGKVNIKVVPLILFMGAILACSAPFIHIFYPNTKNVRLEEVKKKYKEKELTREQYIEQRIAVTYFGYQNMRKFWYSIGKPLSMVYFSFLLMYSSFYINEKQLKKAIQLGSFMAALVSTYFIIWAFWYRADFEEHLYFIAIGIISILSTATSFRIIKQRNSILDKIRILTNHIVFKGKKHVPQENKKEYVKDYLETFNKIV